ncbi:MAG: hypothetical protein JXO44_04340 [Clostridia bacterium]|nr:hypothetical protein [Clostridia bacterium]
MRLSLGMITRDLLTTEPVFDFLENAHRFGHALHSVVIAYSRNIDFEVVNEINRHLKVELVKINEDEEMYSQLRQRGISQKSIDTFLKCPPLDDMHSVTYAKNRNNVITKAILTGTEVLFFIDTDVYPQLLQKDDVGDVIFKDVDFFGRHLEYLKYDDVAITTSDYSGYYIIPPMGFEGMDQLFEGLQKSAACEFIHNNREHHCLVPDHGALRKAFVTNKILGGNVAIKLDALHELVPFFSSSYEVDGRSYLTRGEDTILGIKVHKHRGWECIDIDTRIFHNTFGNYPAIPDVINDQRIKDRFFFACMGWIGRNPFLNWMEGVPIDEMYKRQKAALAIGAPAVAEYLNDERFLRLPEALERAYDRLNYTILEYNRFLLAWQEISQKLQVRSDTCEDIVS